MAASFLQTAFSPSAFSETAFELDGSSAPASVGAGSAWAAGNSPITNTNATADAGNRYNVDMRTGFRVKPGQLIEDPYGALVHPDFADVRHPQELIRPLAEEPKGPIRPEPTDVFLDTTVTAEDL